jgi:hypothetical protein
MPVVATDHNLVRTVELTEFWRAETIGKRQEVDIMMPIHTNKLLLLRHTWIDWVECSKLVTLFWSRHIDVARRITFKSTK